MDDKPASPPASIELLQPTQNTSPDPDTDPQPSTANKANNKRKPDDQDDADADGTTLQIPQAIQKRQRTALIEDPAAITFLKELGLDEEFFDGGKALAWGLQPNDPDFLRIQKYVERGETNTYAVKIQSILRIIPSVHTQDSDTYLDFKDDPKAAGLKRMMLWHGTKWYNVQSILENGLKLPPSGDGIYFADMVCKSCAYTDCAKRANPGIGQSGYLFLSDVLLGKTPPKILSPSPNNVIVTPHQQYGPWQSAKGTDMIGGYGPNSLGDVTIDGCTWPLGYPSGTGIRHHEYIIYDEKQVKPKFLIKFEYPRKG